jgi:murein DD-endopeptidase MepM/ murein hydrolase activator NlpD/phage-related protein
MADIATAYLHLVPSMRGAQGAIAKEATGVGDAVGRRMGGGILSSVKKFAGPIAAVMGTAALANWAKESIASLGRIEAINTQTATAIKSTGGAAGVTAQHVEDLAGRLENMTATEAESIQTGANLLLTFKNIRNEAGAGNDIFDQSVVALTDMARAMGQDPQQAAIQLGKALNDPTKGVAALARVGITFTQQQKDQIAAMQEAGDMAGAQAIVLAELNSQFGGSAAAYADTYKGRIELLGHAFGTFGEAVFSAAMPALKEFARIGADIFNWAAGFFESDAYAAWAERVGGAVGGAADKLNALLFPAEKAEETGDKLAGVGAGLATALAPLVEFGKALWATVGPAVMALVPQLVQVWTALSPLGLILKVLTPLLPMIGAAFSQIATALAGTLVSVLPVIVQLMGVLAQTLTGALARILPVVIQLVMQLVTAFAGSLLQVLPLVATLITTLVGVVAQLLPVLLPLITQGLTVLAKLFSGVLMAVLPSVVQVITTLVGVVAAVLPALLPLISALVSGFLPVLVALLPPLLQLVGAVFPLLAEVIGALLPLLIPLVNLLVKALIPTIGFLSKALRVVIGVVADVISWFAKAIGQGGALRVGLENAWRGIQIALKGAWVIVKTQVIDPLVGAFKTVKATGDTLKEGIGVAFRAIRDSMKVAWEFIRDGIIKPFKQAIKGDLPGAFESARGAIKTAWNKLKGIAAEPVNFIVKTVYNDGLRSGFNTIADKLGLSLRLPTIPAIKFAEGGVLPGYTPGRDVHQFYSPTGGRLDLSGGEAIMRPEFTRAVGGAAGIAALNAAARSGRSLVPHQQFAEGGVFGRIGSFFSNAVEGVTDFLKDPKQAFGNLLRKPMEELLQDVTSSPWGQMLVEVPRAVLTGIISKALGLVEGLAGGGDNSGPLAPGGWARPMRGGRITSGYGPRWGAFHNGVDFAGGGNTFASKAGTVLRTGWNVGYGNTGIGILLGHGGGIETYYGHNPSMAAVRVRPGDKVAQGQHIGHEGATGNVTGTHLHYSAFKGGRAINPANYGVYDDGGKVVPGINVVDNRLREPEALLNPRQWELAEAALGLASQDTGKLVETLIVRDERAAFEELERLRRRRIVRAGLTGRVK